MKMSEDNLDSDHCRDFNNKNLVIKIVCLMLFTPTMVLVVHVKI